jgi:hypothetical protein
MKNIFFFLINRYSIEFSVCLLVHGFYLFGYCSVIEGKGKVVALYSTDCSGFSQFVRQT